MIRKVKIGKLAVGGKSPVRIKGMIKSSLEKRSAVIKEAQQLASEGAEAVRIAIRTKQDLKILPALRKAVTLPWVADIHFDYRLALGAIDAGFDAVRLNPLNIYKPQEVSEVACAARMAKISLRVGVNSGGFKQKFASPLAQGKQMVKKVEDYLKLLEKRRFFDIMVSLKGSDVATTICANRLFRKKHAYPLHLGVTATGSFWEGSVKSSVGLGILLSEGIGDVIRVSLTAP